MARGVPEGQYSVKRKLSRKWYAERAGRDEGLLKSRADHVGNGRRSYSNVCHLAGRIAGVQQARLRVLVDVAVSEAELDPEIHREETPSAHEEQHQ